MKRPLWIWLSFGLCVALAALAMVWLGAMALELERTEARTRRQAELDETLQLALWRMDSALAPLIAEEGMRPYFTYTPFYPAERAYTHMFEVVEKGDVLVASPLLTYSSPLVRLHFQFGPDRLLSSPQVPDGNMRDLAESKFLKPGQLESNAARLVELKLLVTEPAMDLACRSDISASDAPPKETIAKFPSLLADENATQARGSKEFEMRTQNTKKAQTVILEQQIPLATSEPISQGPIEAAWIGDTLILGRRVRVGKATFLQGCWLDWSAIRDELLVSVVDLLPNAALEPLKSDDQAPTRRLAALPARLVIPPTKADVSAKWSPIRLSLWIAWACLAVTAGAVALLLGGTLSLSERRGTFVSAVTHELRTPLTTFRLYTEMLSDGMVSDPEARQSYLKTLRSESDRLGHLVENVLSFSRIERGRSIDRRDTIKLPDLVNRIQPTLTANAERGGMTLLVDKNIPNTQIRTDVSIVEQILSNLVDNASKYATSGSDHRIEWTFAVTGSILRIAIRDHGSGLPERAIKNLFRPFSKSAHEAAHSAPGVGLGLALSRRLARALKGDLQLRSNSPLGASFVLSLPILN